MQRVKFGMVGGGQGAFIGQVHRLAAALDGRAQFVAGALSSTPERSIESGRMLGLEAGRTYGSWREMLEREKALGAKERIDFVSIVTPNYMHYESAEAFARAGFGVVIDKPMVMNSEQAIGLAEAVQAGGGVLGVTYNYSGYPLVMTAREIVRSGQLGTIRRVVAQYHQGWLARNLAAEDGAGGQKQAAWRGEPALAGAGALGDIATHAENLISTVTGLEIEALCAEVSTLVAGRRIDDDVSVLLRFQGGARGVMSVSQVCAGQENNLTLEVFGSEGSLAWRQEQPNELLMTMRDGERRVLTRGGPGMGVLARLGTRLPPGHPEGFIEAFANVYAGVTDAILRRRDGGGAEGTVREFPGLLEGARGVRFVERALASGRGGGEWVAF